MPRRRITRDVPPLTIDPRRQFGRVCLNGSRTPAECIAEGVWAGEDVDQTADDYGTTREEVLLACWWWVLESGHFGECRGKRKRQWRMWAEHAQMVLGGWRKGTKLCDPDEFVVQP